MNINKDGLHVFVDLDEKSENPHSVGVANDDIDIHTKTYNDAENTSVEENEDDDIPERQGLLPPLPERNDDLNSPVTFMDHDSNESSLHSGTQSLEKVITPLNRTRTSSNKYSTTPLNTTNISTPKATDYNYYNSEAHTPGSMTYSGLSTPVRERFNEDSNYSPTITIDERFEVSVEIPSEEAIPKTVEDKIKFFQTFQMKEALEFDKTISSLKKGGWLSSKDLTNLETKKQNHFKKWEIKIKELKNTLKNKKTFNNNDSNSDQFGTYFSPKLKNFESEHLEGDKSPNLQTLEKQFSVLGISR